MSLQVLEQTSCLVKVLDEEGREYWIKRKGFSVKHTSAASGERPTFRVTGTNDGGQALIALSLNDWEKLSEPVRARFTLTTTGQIGINQRQRYQASLPWQDPQLIETCAEIEKQLGFSPGLRTQERLQLARS